MAKPSPRIGISGGSGDSASVNAMIVRIESAGGVPVFLGDHAHRNARKIFKIWNLSAVVFMGNNADINPDDYKVQGKHAKTTVETDTPEGTARAVYEYQLMAEAVKRKMPITGVCGGMQRFNTLCGGTLHQHVPDLVGHDEHSQGAFGIAPFTPVQAVTIEKGTRLAAIADGISTVYTPDHGIRTEVNSMHHQAVAKVGNGLRVAAWGDDVLPDGTRLIEALEVDPKGHLRDQSITLVQWHPEFGGNALGAKFAANIVDGAQKFAKEHHTQSESPPYARPGSMTAAILAQRAAAAAITKSR